MKVEHSSKELEPILIDKCMDHIIIIDGKDGKRISGNVCWAFGKPTQ